MLPRSSRKLFEKGKTEGIRVRNAFVEVLVVDFKFSDPFSRDLDFDV